MELTAAIAVIAALLTTVLTALWARPDMPANHKRLISGSIATVLGAIVAIATGQIPEVPADVAYWLGRILVICAIVIAGAQTLYAQFKGSLTKLEEGTSPNPDDGPVEHVHLLDDDLDG